MDVLPISYSAGLRAEAERPRGKAPEDKRPETDVGQRGNKKSRQDIKPQDLYDSKRINRELLRDYHGLNLKEADKMLDELAPDIAQTAPWKLAEIQPVAHRSLIPSAYV